MSIPRDDRLAAVVDPDTAYDELHPPEALAGAAHQLAKDLTRGATGSLGGIKRLRDGAHAHDLAPHLDLERQALLLLHDLRRRAGRRERLR